MVRAWQRVKSNRGSAGVDGLSIAETAEHLRTHWPRIRESLLDGSYRPLPRWGMFLLQVVAGSALLAVYLLWAAAYLDWVGLQAVALQRGGWMALVLLGAALVYFGALWAAGLKLRQLLRR